MKEDVLSVLKDIRAILIVMSIIILIALVPIACALGKYNAR